MNNQIENSMDQPHVNEQLAPEFLEDAEKYKDETIPGKKEDKLNKNSVLIAISCFLVVSLLLLGYKAFTNVSRSATLNYYIPQPFVETNVFNKLVLANNLNVLYIKPDLNDDKIYICKIISFICRSGYSRRPD